MRKNESRILLNREKPTFFKKIYKFKRVDVVLDLAIALAQSRGYSRAYFLHKVMQLWGETKDVLQEQEHEKWMKQIGLRCRT
jgi:hypothetical protein